MGAAPTGAARALHLACAWLGGSVAALTVACNEPPHATVATVAVPSAAGATSAVAPSSARPEPVARPVDVPRPAGADAGTHAAQHPAAGVAPSLDAPRSPPGPDALLAPDLLAPDGTPLPQTHDRPSTDSAGFRLRLERLVDAIAHDDPELAMPAFFPRVAYEQVKAIADPGRDWQQRLVRAFQRDVHEYHRLLGSDAAGVRLAGLATNERAVRWMDPGAEGNRTGYYRVTRSRLRLRLTSGTERELELTSLISWRGAWYVVHLHGFG